MDRVKFLIIFTLILSICYAKRRSFGQLPTNLMPLKYKISIQPYFPADGISYPADKNFTFNANLTISINCLDDTDNITLNANEIILRKENIQLIELGSKSKIPVINYIFDNSSQQMVISLKNTLKSKKNYELNLAYAGKIWSTNEFAGLFAENYKENGKSKWMLVTQFEATDARRMIPSFDEPFYKAIFEVTVIHPTSMVALSNSMDEKKPDKLGNGWTKTVFSPTVKMSLYLLAIVICDFSHKSAYLADNKTLVRVWARPSFINKTDYSLFAATKVLNHYNEYFGMPYPLKKQDLVALPDFVSAGAMENWGLITYLEIHIVYNESISSSAERMLLASVFAHELAHQWFGNLVTMEWWDDLWLNEGFATYMSTIGTDNISDKKFRQDEYAAADTVGQALALDEMSTSHPIFVPVSSPDEIMEIFDTISYAKGAAVIRMLNYTITEKLLRQGLKNYLTKFAYKNANHNDLWSALSEVVQNSPTTILDWSGKPLDVAAFMNPWVEQMGYPVLNVNRRYDQKIAIIDQHRFVLSDNIPATARPDFLEPAYNFTWFVQIRYLISSSSGVEYDHVWAEPNKTTVLTTGGEGDWILVNDERAAICRVNYDERNWILLTKQLQSDYKKIQLKNRVQLIDDALELARANQLSYEIALNLSTYLINETEYLPWLAVFGAIESAASASSGTASPSGNFKFLKNMLVDSAGYQIYKNYLSKLLAPIYTRLGWDDTKESVDDIFTHSLRVLALTQQCNLELSDCKEQAEKEYQHFANLCSERNSISSQCSPIKPNLRRIVYCEGAKSANTTAWDLLWSLYNKEQVANEKGRLMYGMCCTKNPDLILKLLNEVINENSTMIARQDSANVFEYLAMNDDARPLLWPFIEENFPSFKAIYSEGMFGLDVMIRNAASSFNSDQRLQTLKKFYQDHILEFGTAKRAIEQQIELTEANTAWMKRNGDIIFNVTRIKLLSHTNRVPPPRSNRKTWKSTLSASCTFLASFHRQL